MSKIDEMQAIYAQRVAEEDEAKRLRQLAQNDLVTAKADAIGLHIGSIVCVDQTIGYATPRKVLHKRYQVTGISLLSWGTRGLSLCGRLIRKDGTLGDRSPRISDNWKLEQCYSQL